MSDSERFVAPLGKPIKKDELRIRRAQEFLQFIEGAGPACYAQVVDVRRFEEANAEIIVFDTEVERCRILAYPIERTERMQVAFSADDTRAPEVYALRRDFPACPHIMLTRTVVPKHLCLYEQAWDDVRLNWTAANFLSRIRYWLAKTASGTLHADDQPLEPLIMPGGSQLILPADFSLEKSQGKHGLLSIYRLGETNGVHTLAAYWNERGPAKNIRFAAAVFECNPQTHGVVRHQPSNLAELQELCAAAGLNLANDLARKIQNWHAEKPDPQILKAQLVIILLLPKTRTGTVIEKVDICAFLMGLSIEQVGQKLGVIEKHQGIAGYVLGQQGVDASVLPTIDIGMLQVVPSLDAEKAAKLNDVEPFNGKICAIGVGALGSQVFNNLLRAGFGSWTLIDNDILLPHNCARHFLGEWAVGHPKALAMADIATNTLGDGNLAKGVVENVLKSGSSTTASDALRAAELIIDASASVAVSRHLAHNEYRGRVLSTYMVPKGDSLAVAIEDKARKVRLDWLEMLHYRGVLNIPQLAAGFQVGDDLVRYGNSCRDLSSRIAQDNVAMWAAIASKCIKSVGGSDEATLRIYQANEDGAVAVFPMEVSPLVQVSLGPWTIVFDQGLIAKLAAHRASRLPNETGGVLVGHFDTLHHVCYVVDTIPSPPDSIEWPISYIRGCEGLSAKVSEVQTKTLDQLTYVGEWHSHPDKCSTKPSEDDIEAYGWISSQMDVEGLPAVMLIIGEGDRFTFVSTIAASSRDSGA